MSGIKEVRLKSWSEFDKLVKKRSYRRWIYRGQEDSSWELQSSLFRAFKTAQDLHELGKGRKKKISRHEHARVMIERFKSNAHLYLTHFPKDDDDFSWLALMQHYGAPSRLLDFSFSPYVAAYFALENGIEDAAIYSVEHSGLKTSDEVFFDESCKLRKSYCNIRH